MISPIRVLPMLQAAVLLVLATLGHADAAAEDPTRGVVFILTDDQRADHLGVAGRAGLATPAIDALADRGTRFDRAYCQGSRSGAVCLPSRSRMLTGGSDWTTPDWSAAQRADDHPLWPEVLRNAGWRTHHVSTLALDFIVLAQEARAAAVDVVEALARSERAEARAADGREHHKDPQQHVR